MKTWIPLVPSTNTNTVKNHYICRKTHWLKAQQDQTNVHVVNHLSSNCEKFSMSFMCKQKSRQFLARICQLPWSCIKVGQNLEMLFASAGKLQKVVDVKELKIWKNFGLRHSIFHCVFLSRSYRNSLSVVSWWADKDIVWALEVLRTELLKFRIIVTASLNSYHHSQLSLLFHVV